MATLDHVGKTVPFVIAGLSTLLNILLCLIYILMKNRRYRNKSHFLLFMTALGDLFTTSIIWAIAILKNTSKYEEIDAEFVIDSLTKYSFILSLLILLLCAVDRYCAIALPFWHSANVTHTVLAIAAGAVWIISGEYVECGSVQFFPCSWSNLVWGAHH